MNKKRINKYDSVNNDGMKKLLAVVIFFAAGLIFTAVWFSPLVAAGEPVLYENNCEIEHMRGVCYPADGCYRVDGTGDIDGMYDALYGMGATVVKTAEAGGDIIVYAYSPRVCGTPERTSDGQKYNVMAAYRDGRYCIGTPVLQGSY